MASLKDKTACYTISLDLPFARLRLPRRQGTAGGFDDLPGPRQPLRIARIEPRSHDRIALGQRGMKTPIAPFLQQGAAFRPHRSKLQKRNSGQRPLLDATTWQCSPDAES